MATIRERNGSYTVMIRKRGYDTITQTFSSKRKAEQWAQRTESAIEEGMAVDSVRFTLAEAIDRFLDDPDRKLTKYDRSILDWFRKRLGGRRITQLRRRDFVTVRDELRKTESKHGKRLSPSTVNRRMSRISAVLTAAMHEWDWISSNPARIPALKEGEGRERLLTDGERKRFLAACKACAEPHMYAFVVCAMLSGARAGELVGLRWKDIDLDAGIARLLKTKNGKRRSVPIRGHALELLTKMNAERIADPVVLLDQDEFVFKNKTGYAPFYYRKVWVEIRQAAHLEYFRFHDLRHLAASMLAMSGASQRELQEVMGHESAAMTKRYSHFFDTHIAELGDRINEKLFGAG